MTRINGNMYLEGSASISKKVWEHSFDPILFLDRDYRPISVNPAMQRFLESLRESGLVDPEAELIHALRELRILESRKSQYSTLLQVGGISCLANLVLQEEGLLVLLRKKKLDREQP